MWRFACFSLFQIDATQNTFWLPHQNRSYFKTFLKALVNCDRFVSMFGIFVWQEELKNESNCCSSNLISWPALFRQGIAVHVYTVVTFRLKITATIWRKTLKPEKRWHLSHTALFFSISPCSYGDSWRFMLIHALRIYDIEHQSNLNIKVI